MTRVSTERRVTFTRAGLLVLAAVLPLPLVPAAAQWRASVQAGTGQASIGEGPSATVFAVAPEFEYLGHGFRLSARGSYADHAGRGTGTEGRATAAAGMSLFGSLRAELEATGAWSDLSWRDFTSGWIGAAHLQLGSALSGLRGGVGIGRSYRQGTVQPITRYEASTWQGFGAFLLRLSFARTGSSSLSGGTGSGVTNDPFTPPDTLILGGGDRQQSRRLLQDPYFDAGLSLHWTGGPVEIGSGLGRRFGKPTIQFTTWHVAGAYRISPTLALVGSLGHYPADPVSGQPSGRFATLGMRVSLRPHESAVPERTPAAGHREATEVVKADAGRYLLSVYAPRATTVEIMGSFNDWTPAELAPLDHERWGALFPLTPGVHEINVRIDGGPWIAPPGLPRMRDEFAGTVGVLLVE
ncbi:MAG: glycogen-binding domain-containing protein [Gemmatimonadales bacterium]